MEARPLVRRYQQGGDGDDDGNGDGNDFKSLSQDLTRSLVENSCPSSNTISAHGLSTSLVVGGGILNFLSFVLYRTSTFDLNFSSSISRAVIRTLFSTI